MEVKKVPWRLESHLSPPDGVLVPLPSICSFELVSSAEAPVTHAHMASQLLSTAEKCQTTLSLRWW